MTRLPQLPEMVLAPVPIPAGPGASAYQIAVTASPMTYTAQSRQAFHVTGGTISTISYGRGALLLALGVLTGGQLIELNPGDRVQIAYLTAPTIWIFPR